ncbi:hypothetical protein GOP47_0024698 [Adiantum capillus-veneris]|uniref:LIM zinc-binding domain-containing protein n=1 Tax=Adiantum capillus-veneris TaxID=13818 RepID=A0A9D4Z2W6_ADICA|nr:hypothetical protein GOP47_0024698 [Adiantum capillus-veneris]
MKWLDRIFKGSSHHRVGEYESSRYENNDALTNIDRDYKSREQVEDEELDHAIALSLSEADYRRANGNHSPQVEDDEDLARALQASLDLEEPSPRPVPARVHAPTGRRYKQHIAQEKHKSLLYTCQFTSKIPLPKGHVQATNVVTRNHGHHEMRSSKVLRVKYFRVCEGCKNEIGYGRFLSCMGSVWHPDCFCCYACNTPISDHEFSMSGNNPYHKSCYKELFHPRCDVCKEFIPTNTTGLIEYRAHPFWGQKYCPSHEIDSTPRCCSCERVESKDAQYISLDDGRKLCLECLDSAVMDTGDCQPLYHEIRDFYEGMNMKIEQQIPMLLVQRQALNEAMEGEKEGHHHMPETRGLCLSEEQTVNIIFRKPRIGAGNSIIDMRTESQKLTRHCEVTAILVLYGLPRLLTGSILAHELMHAWLRLNGFRNLQPDVEEGICQVLAHMWLESEVMAGSSSSSSSSSSAAKKGPKSEVEKKLGGFFLHQIAMDSSPIYGEGFRAGHASMVQFGLRSTLEHIKMTGSFPL